MIHLVVNNFGCPSRFILMLRHWRQRSQVIVRLRPPRRVIHIEFNGEDGNHTRELKRRESSSRRCMVSCRLRREYAYGGIADSSA